MKFGSSLMAAAFVLVLIQVNSAQAGMTGHEITAEWIYPNFGQILETHNVVVGQDIELPETAIQNDTKFSIDLADHYILFTLVHGPAYWQDTPANGWLFIDKNGTLDAIIDFKIGAITGNVTGLDPQDLTFTADSVFINCGASGPGGSVVWQDGSTMRFDLTFVPEPVSLLLLGLGGLLMRKR